VGRVALWIFLLIAFVVLPRSRSSAQRSPLLLAAMVRGSIGVTLAPYHLAYHLQFGHASAVTVLYVVAVTGSLVLSGYRHVFAFGLVNLIAVSLLA